MSEPTVKPYFLPAELTKYLTNPSPRHHEAADQAIRYLYATRFLSIEYSAQDDDILVIASDASFADDIEDRKSSQGYVIKLFGGPIVWKASKQNTVTTSTTEAELLALEQTAKETYALNRLFRDVALDLGDSIKLFCDDQQTIRLVRYASRWSHQAAPEATIRTIRTAFRARRP